MSTLPTGSAAECWAVEEICPPDLDAIAPLLREVCAADTLERTAPVIASIESEQVMVSSSTSVGNSAGSGWRLIPQPLDDTTA